MQPNTSHIPESEPLREGVSPIALRQFNRQLERSSAAMRGYVLLRHGKKVAEKYWEPYTPQDKNWVYSISKSFTSTAAGLAYDAGLLDLDARVISFFPDETPPEPDENLKAMRVRHLLSMNTGHDKDTTISVVFSPDWVKTFLNTTVDHKPGTHFTYNSGASYVLSAILQKLTGKTVIDYLRPRLFEPLGFENYTADINPAGVFNGGWGLIIRVEDLAKLGQLYLNKGTYNGQRIVSEEWVAMASSFQSDNSGADRENEPSDWQQGYGFQFWRCQHNAFRADGAFGQYCLVMPDQDAVLALMSELKGPMQEIMDIIWNTLLPGFSSIASPIEDRINGKTFHLGRNMADLKTAEFLFSGNTLTFSIRDDEGEYTLQSSRGDWLEGVSTLPIGERAMLPFFSLDNLPTRVSSYFQWTDENTLEIFWVYRETPHRERLVCRFDGNNVSLLCHSSVTAERDEDDEDFTGTME